MIGQFKDANYTLVDPEEPFEGKVLYIDPHCSDMLVLPAECRDFILEHELLHSGQIVLQVMK